MKTLVKSALARVHLDKPAGHVYRSLRLASRIVLRTDRRLASRYLAEAREPRLHIGCAGHLLDGWLNSDVHPRTGNVLRLDATRRFPFPDGVFVHAYSEHVIEHLSFSQAASMLDECFRVLSPGGKVRITTPDLSFLVDLHGRGPSAEAGGRGGGGGGRACPSLDGTFRFAGTVHRMGKRHGRSAGYGERLRDQPLHARMGAPVHL